MLGLRCYFDYRRCSASTCDVDLVDFVVQIHGCDLNMASIGNNLLTGRSASYQETSKIVTIVGCWTGPRISRWSLNLGAAENAGQYEDGVLECSTLGFLKRTKNADKPTGQALIREEFVWDWFISHLLQNTTSPCRSRDMASYSDPQEETKQVWTRNDDEWKPLTCPSTVIPVVNTMKGPI